MTKCDLPKTNMKFDMILQKRIGHVCHVYSQCKSISETFSLVLMISVTILNAKLFSPICSKWTQSSWSFLFKYTKLYNSSIFKSKYTSE